MKQGVRKILVIWIAVLCCSVCGCVAQSVESYAYVHRDTGWLELDVYRPVYVRRGAPTVIYFYGGAFVGGWRRQEKSVNYCKALQQQGYTVVSVDYRLGLRGVKKMRPIQVERAIEMAADDGLAAVAYVLKQAPMLGVNSSQIYLVGSSAGAITALQMDYLWANGQSLGNDLPAAFRFAGVVAYAGGVFSRDGRPDYEKHAPAPTLFLHGTEDYVVPYRKISFFTLGMFGTDALVKQFDKCGYAYYVRRYETLGHQVANYNRITIPLLNYFVTVFGMDRASLRIDERYYDASEDPVGAGRKGLRQLRRLVQQPREDRY